MTNYRKLPTSLSALYRAKHQVVHPVGNESPFALTFNSALSVLKRATFVPYAVASLMTFTMVSYLLNDILKT